MKTRRKRSRGERGPRGGAVRQTIAAAEFKARSLELMDRVRQTGAEYIVTKHKEPVAKLVPYVASRRSRLFGSMKGTVLQYERPFDPIDAEWDLNRD
jgi:prevent-host-death family protein